MFPIRIRKIISLLAVTAALSVCLVSHPVYSADEDIPPTVRMPYRIFRGVVNIALGWTEILLRPIGEIKNESFTDSLAKGSYNALQRSAAGFQDIFMFWVPDMQMEDIYPDWQVWPYLFHWS